VSGSPDFHEIVTIDRASAMLTLLVVWRQVAL